MHLDLITLYAAPGTAKFACLPAYEARVKELVPPGAEVTITGQRPAGLYLRLAHALHGRASRLLYDSPVTGPVEVFNHDPH